MKRNVLISGMALLVGSLIAADSSPKDEVKSAAKKLGEKSNYSWKTTVAVPESSQFRPGPTEGKTEKDGFTYVTMSFGNNTTEAAIKGDKRALKTQEGWQSMEELASAGGGGGRGAFRGGMLRNLKAPAAQAEDLLGKVKDLKSDDGAYSGDLTDEGAKTLLTFGGRGGGNAPDVRGAKGSVKFWIKDGVLSKYQFKLQGTVTFNNNDIDLDRTSTVEIKDVGTTKVEVPDEAKKKLS